MTDNRNLRTRLLIGASLSAMLLTGIAQAQSEGGYRTGRGGGADPAAAAARAAQDQAIRQTQTNSATQRALEAFRRAAQTRTQMQDAQMQARIAASQAINNVPNGLGAGGLQAAPEIEIDPSLWVGANGPAQNAGKDGRTNVTVEQTESKAILTWDSFNVGRETDLTFNQQGADWVVLNRVRDASPSQIHGSVNAKGTVLILNQNGILFGGASTVNVRNLVASSANITNDDFLNRGIYSNLSGSNYLPSFTDAGGAITVEAGAQIKTHAPASATQGGGYVLLMGTRVTNAGSITTPKGQTLLTAGDDFLVRRGYGTDGNQYSTTRGNEVRALIDAESTSGTVINSGLIEAPQGDITLGGRTIRQDGVMVATTGVNQRGTIHLLNSASDAQGSVTLGKDSLTIILPELEAKDTALNGQRDALVKESETANLLRSGTTNGGFDDRSLLADRLDQSRIEIVTGGTVTFEGGSNTSAQGGQVAVQANNGRITVADGARIDVSGVMGVALDMESNSILVNVQGNELRDSPANRENEALRSENIWLDVRDLVLLPDGTGGYEGDRWYTKGGLLEVGGHLANMAHGIGEWAAVGGTITLAASEVVAHKGATFDISGGSLDYAAGWVNSTRVLGADGKLYDVSNAPAWMKMLAWGDAFVRKHDRWGEAYTQVWSHPLGGARASRRWSEGYSVGRDAGKLILSAPTAIMEANILAETIQGERQTIARADGVTDGYKLGQHTVAHNGTLAVGGYTALGNTNPFGTTITVGDVDAITADLESGGTLPADRTGTVQIDAAYLNAQNLGGLELATRDAISIESDLKLADGGHVALLAPDINISAGITAHGGRFSSDNILNATPGTPSPVWQALLLNGKSGFTLAETGAIDLTGLWLNGQGQSDGFAGLGHVDGGKVRIEFSGDVTIAAGSRIDVSSGGAILPNGEFVGGKGGDVALIAGSERVSGIAGRLALGGVLAAHGAKGGGTLSLTTGGRLIIGTQTLAEDALYLSTDRFQSGFSAYDINGQGGVSVAEGATVDVAMPVYRFTDTSMSAPTGIAATDALELWTPPIYQEDPTGSRLIQRGGANLTLRSERLLQGGAVEIGKGATVSVDPGATIRIASATQMTVEGRLNAWGGSILFDEIRAQSAYYSSEAHNRSIWIGEAAVLDVAGRGVSAVDAQGRRYGLVQAGGTIQLGSALDWESGDAVERRPADMHVVIRPGAVLDASGSSVALDLPGLDKGSTRNAVTVASDGGTIVLGSANSIHIDGTLKATAGGQGAAGGTLALTYNGGIYARSQASAEVLTPRMLVLTQTKREDPLGDGVQPGDKLAYGTAYLGMDQIEAGGFGNLSIFAPIRTPDDLTLSMGQSLRLWSPLGVLADAQAGRTISLSAPYLKLGQTAYAANGNTEAAYALPLPDATDRKDILRIEADHIDVHGRNEFLGFGDVAISSQGDIRMMAAPTIVGSGRTTLFAPDLMTVTAAQIYAASGADAYLGVGFTNGVSVQSDPDDHLIIRSWGAPAPAAPYSVGGRLSVFGGLIEQGGVLRAPLGQMVIGAPYENPVVRFLDGSLTSVSGAGLIMPYGGTVDGIKYELNGQEISIPSVGGTSVAQERQLLIAGEQIVVEKGAVLDLSGGGDLKGAGFVSGRGGSVDILTTALADANPAFAFSRSGNPVYALVPGYTGGYAPTGGSQGQGTPATGQQVTIPDGVPGLPAGTYTLMPSSYALLPGAFRVEIGATSSTGLSGVSPTSTLR